MKNTLKTILMLGATALLAACNGSTKEAATFDIGYYAVVNRGYEICDSEYMMKGFVGEYTNEEVFAYGYEELYTSLTNQGVRVQIDFVNLRTHYQRTCKYTYTDKIVTSDSYSYYMTNIEGYFFFDKTYGLIDCIIDYNASDPKWEAHVVENKNDLVGEFLNSYSGENTFEEFVAEKMAFRLCDWYPSIDFSCNITDLSEYYETSLLDGGDVKRTFEGTIDTDGVIRAKETAYAKNVVTSEGSFTESASFEGILEKDLVTYTKFNYSYKGTDSYEPDCLYFDNGSFEAKLERKDVNVGIYDAFEDVLL